MLEKHKIDKKNIDGNLALVYLSKGKRCSPPASRLLQIGVLPIIFFRRLGGSFFFVALDSYFLPPRKTPENTIELNFYIAKESINHLIGRTHS